MLATRLRLWHIVLGVACGILAVSVSLTAVAIRAGVQHRLYDDLLYSVVARQVTLGALDDAERVDRLTQYVFENVHAPRDALLDDDGPPAQTLIGGYGFCDQQVRLFMELARMAGLSTRELFLLDTTTGASPHTVAEVQEGSRWAVVDVLFGHAAKRADGSPATVADVVAGSDPIIRLTGLTPSDYEHARVQLQMGANPIVGRLWQLFPIWLIDRVQDLYLRMAPPTIPVPNGFSQFRQPDQQLYWQARNHELFGRRDSALAEYQHLLDGYPSSRYANDARYNLALLAKTDTPQAALQQLGQLQSHQPSAAVRADGLFLAGQIYESLASSQACQNALDVYGRVAAGTSEAAAAAFFSLSQTPCSSVVRQPLASFGPLDLSAITLNENGVGLLWRVIAAMTQDYTVFVHALNAQGQIIAQNDAQPDRGALPTSTLRPGELIPDDHRVTLPALTAQIEIGVYLLDTGVRLTQPGGDDAYLAPVVFSLGPRGTLRPQLAASTPDA